MSLYPGYCAFLVTPRGTGAIAVIRLVGPDAVGLIKAIWMPHRSGQLVAGKLSYGQLMDGEEIVDDVLLSVEAVNETEVALEISCHGGVRIVQRILRLLERCGVQIVTDPLGNLGFWPAQNKIDAEAIEKLTQVKTRRAAHYAAFLRNEMSKALQQRALDHGQKKDGAAWLKEMVARFDAANALLHGIKVCIIGPPNSGKSTLFNTLLGRQAVVTSPVAGTTRDWVAETMEFEGLALELVDTAGRRETECKLEMQAIMAGNFTIGSSDLTLLVLDQSVPFPGEVLDWARGAPPKPWVVGNKSDLGLCWTKDVLTEMGRVFGSPPIFVSAMTGEGCDILKRSVLKHFGLLDPRAPGLAFFTERQRSLAAQALVENGPNRKLYKSMMQAELAESNC